MPARYRIDIENRLVLSTVWGVVTNEDMRAHSSRLADDPNFDPTFRQLTDLRDVSDFEVSVAALRIQSRVTPWKSGARRAFVSTHDKTYGMLRMFESFAAAGEVEIRIFREMSQARTWLNLDEIE